MIHAHAVCTPLFPLFIGPRSFVARSTCPSSSCPLSFLSIIFAIAREWITYSLTSSSSGPNLKPNLKLLDLTEKNRPEIPSASNHEKNSNPFSMSIPKKHYLQYSESSQLNAIGDTFAFDIVDTKPLTSVRMLDHGLSLLSTSISLEKQLQRYRFHAGK